MMKKLFTIIILFICCEIKSQTKDTSKTKTESHVEQMPEYPGGVTEMMKYVGSNIKYPKHARKKGIQGKCFLKFTVMKDGSIDSVRVLKGVTDCPECDAEAVRVVKEMPKWTPGRIDGRPVPVYFNLPINFTIKER